MSRSDRLFRLLHAMRMMAPPITAQRLADEMEVSLRSLYRDIDSLRAAGARIEGERGYGYRLIEDNALRPQSFTRIEIEAIALGLAQVRAMGDPALSGAAAAVLAKVSATLPEGRDQHLLHAVSQVFLPEDAAPDPAVIDAVRTACWDEAVLAIDYRDKAGAQTHREIQPLAIVYTERALTVLSWCLLRREFRMFRLERLMSVELTGERFRPHRAALLRRYRAQLEAERAALSPS